MSNPIRVLQMIGSLNIGGSQALVMNLYRAIDKNRIQFDYIIDHPDERYFAEEIEAMGGRIYEMPGFKGTNFKEISNAWNAFFKAHPEYKVLHSHVRSYASLYLPIAKKNGLATIIHSHSTSNGGGLSSLVKTCLQYSLRFQADYFFGCSKEAGEWLFGKRTVNGNKYKMIPNAVNTKLYRYNEELRKKYRTEMSIKNDQKVYIHVGRLHEAKNHIFLLEVFAGILKKQENSMLLVIGDGDLKEQIRQKIQELSIGHAVRMLGARSDVTGLLQAADCFLFPSRWEGLPVTVVEAQAAGLPCFVSDTVTRDVGVSELAHYLPIDNPAVWADRVTQCDLTRKDVVNEIIKAGFDVNSTSEWLSVFYRELHEKVHKE